MKKLAFYFFLFLCYTNLFSQNTFTSFASTSNEENSINFEKVYLHIDRTSYISGENIWFKAYLVDASTNMLADHSKNLHVELISPNSRIVQTRILQVEDGVAMGDFKLPESAMSGRYLIRAYTNWMRNFSDFFFFTKEITVANSADADKQWHKKLIAPQARIDIQFFPEGGSLIDSIPTKMAFKAVDTTGIGCYVKGVIKSNSGKIISLFESSYLGMGVTNFTPTTDETYTAEGVASNGEKFMVRLPTIFNTGMTLGVTDKNEKEINIVVRTNRKTLQSGTNKVFNLKVSSRNQVYLIDSFKISSLANGITIPISDLPEGIDRLTLFSDEGKPQSERLVYINKKQDFKILISADSKTYAPRSEVKLDVKVEDALGNSELANLSLATIDASIENSAGMSGSTIISYILLESELKGRIEQPGYYFDSNNADRWEKLDLLLLTQGWRDFIWRYLPETVIHPEFSLESGLTLTGKVRRVGFNKPLNKANISLTLIDDSSKYYALTRTDSLGRFCFDSLYFNGAMNIILSAKANNKRFKELITMDSMIYKSPNLDYWHSYNSIDFLSTINKLSTESIYQKMIKKKYHLSDTIVLDEVVIKNRILKNQFKDDHYRIYTHASNIVTVTEQDAGKGSIFELIRNVPGITVIKTNFINGDSPEYIIKVGRANIIQTPGLKDPPVLFLLDGMPTDIQTLANYPVYMVDKIEIIKRGTAAIFGGAGFNGVISVLTKSKLGTYVLPLSTIHKKIAGYDASRIFYAPKYSSSNTFADKPDLRNTIYWNPNIITTSEEGEKVTFFNADKSTTVEVKAEGITRTGVPVTGFFRYEVK